MLQTAQDLQSCAIRRCEDRATVPEVIRAEYHDRCQR
jgi:hypothetical protein